MGLSWHAAGNRGAGIFANGNSSVRVTGSRFVSNRAEEGGGLFAAGFADLSASGCVFQSNAAIVSGAGAAYSEAATGALLDSAFLANAAPLGGSAVFIDRGPSSAGSDANIGSSPLDAPSVYPVNPASPAVASDWELLLLNEGGGRAAAAAKHAGGAAHTAAVAHRRSANSSEEDGPRASVGYRPFVAPLKVQNLTFNGNRGARSQGSAYMDASFDSSSRSTCDGCRSLTRGDSVGSVPAQFRMM